MLIMAGEMAQWLGALDSRGSRFNFQHPHGSTQLSVTPVPDDLTLSHRCTYRQHTNTHKAIINIFLSYKIKEYVSQV